MGSKERRSTVLSPEEEALIVASVLMENLLKVRRLRQAW